MPLQHFTTLNVPQTFHLDQSDLKRNYYAQVASAYDTFSDNNNQSNVTRSSDSLKDRLIDLRTAYDTLRDDLSRAQYLLSHKNLKDKNLSKNKNTDLLTVKDYDEFLDLSDLKSNNNNNNNNHCSNLNSILKQKIDECRANFDSPYYVQRWVYLNKLRGV